MCIIPFGGFFAVAQHRAGTYRKTSEVKVVLEALSSTGTYICQVPSDENFHIDVVRPQMSRFLFKLTKH
jgi:hypothetical protein